jgi:transposase
MPTALRLQVSEEEHARVARQYEETDQAEVRTRYQMVLLALEGLHAPAIAPRVRRSVATVQRVLRRYQVEGVSGVPHRRRPGRPAVVPAAWKAALLRVIDLDPPAVGVKSATWTTQLLAAYLAEQTGHRTGIETVRTHLHQADYVCKRPTWTLRRKAEEQPDWAKNA